MAIIETHYLENHIMCMLVDTIGVTEAQEYKTNPVFYGMGHFSFVHNVTGDVTTSATVTPTADNRAAIILKETNDSFLQGYFNTVSFDQHIDFSDGNYNDYSGSQMPNITYSTVASGGVEYYTNIPVFENATDATAYLSAASEAAELVALRKAINLVAEIQPNMSDFTIVNMWTHGIWLNNTQPQVSIVYHRDFRASLVSGRIALYTISGIDDGKLKYGIINDAVFENMQYSTDGQTWTDTATFPYGYFLRKRVTELGEFDYALTFSNDYLPIFKNQTEAQEYIDGLRPITDAENWGEISGNYPGIENETGEDDDGTDWGSVKTRSFFSQQYLCGWGAVQEISNALFDTGQSGIWENIKKGLEMYSNPIESVISLMYYPVDLASVFTDTAGDSPNIWFGGYQFTMQSHTARKIVHPDGYYNCGGIYFERLFKNWRDCLATRIFVDLPYCGRYELDPSKYWGKYVKVIYYIDTHTGGCTACLVEGAAVGRNGKCLDQYNGQMGVNCPITLTDFSAYANSQINTLLGGGGQAITGGMQIGETGAHAAIASNALGVAGASVSAAALGAVQGAKTVYGLKMNNINKFNQTRGGSTGMLNQYVNQRPTFIFVYPKTSNPSNFNSMVGSPSNSGGIVGNFSGYFEADMLKLKMTGATESEKEKARALLTGGVYIN